jgi:hypothetical protein
VNGFRPRPWTAGGHRQTLLGHWTRRRLRWSLPTEDLVVEAGDDARILVRASWQPGPRPARPALVLVHGLGGWDGASYVLATGLHAFARGWHVLRMNMRGAGDGIRVCARLYNAGLDTDLLAVLEAASADVARLAVVGFSLGGNLALLTLGRCRGRLPAGLGAAAAVSPPLDLAASAAALERAGNRLYQWYLLSGLQTGYRRRQARRPDLYAPGKERGTRTIREFDELVTAPYGGYRDAAEYYERSSAGRYLAGLDRPVLVLASRDDPMIPIASVERWPAAGCVRREVLPTGGHVGFVSPTAAPGRFWAAERVVAFVEGALPA